MKNIELIQNLNSEDIRNLQRIMSLINDSKPKSEIDLQSFKEEYLRYSKQSFSTKYSKSIECSFKHLIHHFGNRQLLNDIFIKDVEEFSFELRKSAPKGYIVYFRNLKASFNKAIDWEYLKSNPFNKIKLSKCMQTKPDFISETELNQIIKHLDNTVIKNIIITAYYTGCRLNEIISLKVKHINLIDKIIVVGDEENITKSRKQREIPICEHLMDVFQRLLKSNKEKEKYVFEKTSGYKYDGDYVSKKFKAAVRAAQLRETLHFHSLRHSFGSTLGMKGVPIITVKELMGHSSITTTQIYSHTTLHDMRRAISTFNQSGGEM